MSFRENAKSQRDFIKHPVHFAAAPNPVRACQWLNNSYSINITEHRKGAKMIVSRRNPWLLAAILMLVGLSACKVDLDQEVWLNADNSGKALLKAAVSIPRFSEDDEENAKLSSENALQDFADRVKDNAGATLNRFETNTDHSSDDYKYIYELEFAFKDLQTLRNIICEDSSQGFNVENAKGGKVLALDIHNLLLQQESDIQDYLNMMDMDMTISLHLPQEPTKIVSDIPHVATKQDVVWTVTLDDKWYRQNLKPILVSF